MTHRIRLVLVALFCPGLAFAQQTTLTSDGNLHTASKSTPNGIVTGHVYLDDTKGPARRATVSLVPAASLETDAAPNRSAPPAQGPVTASVETQFDGSYAFTHVAPGSYYVLAECSGYISPSVALGIAERRASHGAWTPLAPAQLEARNQVLESLPRVDVQSSAPATTDITLERGAAVSGTITYDDGTPAAGLQVAPLARMHADGEEKWDDVRIGPNFRANFFSLGLHFTDDRGNYRISGLPPGKYALRAWLESSSLKSFTSASGSSSYSSSASASTLFIYSGNTPRQKDAVAFTLQQREERTGEDIVIPMSKLHTVRAVLVAARDGHQLNGGGATLLHADDRSLVAEQSLTEDDPALIFSFVFEGDYILESTGASDVDYEPLPSPRGNLGPPQFEAHPRRFYGRAAVPLHVTGDVDNVLIPVPDPTPKEAEMFQDLQRRQQQQKHVTISGTSQ